MRVTSQSLAPKGFLGRSLDEFKRLSLYALTGEGTQAHVKPFPLISFDQPESRDLCKAMSDQDIGGFSQAHLDWLAPDTDSEQLPSKTSYGHVRFHGNISIELPPNRPDIQRSGYAAWRTLDRGPTVFGKSLWNIDPYHYLALRIKSDGRKYFVNLQTESIVATDIHQHRLYARRPGQWETVLIKWNDFVRTNHGAVVEPQGEMLRQKLRTIGFGLTDRTPGPFDISIGRIWTTNALSKEDIEEDGRAEEGQLKTTHGEKLRWNTDKLDRPPT